MLNRAKKAFTLLELIVVLLVLGVLAAIAVPTYTTVKTNSVKRSVQSTLEAIDRNGEAVYSSDTNLSDSAVATAAAEGVTGTSGDRVIAVAAEVATVTLESGTISCSGDVTFTDGIGAISVVTC